MPKGIIEREMTVRGERREAIKVSHPLSFSKMEWVRAYFSEAVRTALPHLRITFSSRP